MNTNLLQNNKSLVDSFFKSIANKLNSNLTINSRELDSVELEHNILEALHYIFSSKKDDNKNTITISIFTSIKNNTVHNGLCSCASFNTEYLQENSTEEDNKATALFEFIINGCDGTLFDNQDLDKEYTFDDIYKMLNEGV